MKVIGLTGSIGCGKSSVAKILNEEYNIPIIDADKISKQAVSKNSNGLKKIEEIFGEEYITKSGELNRIKMGDLVFSSQSDRIKLNNIIHPEVIKIFNKLKEQYLKEGHEYIIYDCPLLIEENLMDSVDIVMIVYANLNTQIDRIIHRDNISKNDARKRINSQMSIEDKKKYADILIDNNGDKERLQLVVREIYKNKL